MPTSYSQATRHEPERFAEVPVSPHAATMTTDQKRSLAELVPADGKLLKFHKSLCPKCAASGDWRLMLTPSALYERGGKVWMVKECSKHGPTKELYWSDFNMYERAEGFQDPGLELETLQVAKKRDSILCPLDCGLCAEHETHTNLANIVMTNRCDLSCWYCLPYNEELLAKIGDKTKRIKIGDLVENEITRNPKKIEGMEGFYAVPRTNIEVLTFEDGKASWARVKTILKRKYRGKFVKVRTLTGKEIVTTADHRFASISEKFQKKPISDIHDEKMLTISSLPGAQPPERLDLFESFKDMPAEEARKVYVHKVSDLFSALKQSGNIKDFFPTETAFYLWKHNDSMPLDAYRRVAEKTGFSPNGISFGVDAKQYEMGRTFEITKEFAKLVGYFVADGHYAKQNVWYTCEDEFVRNDIISCLESLGLTYCVVKVKGKATQINVGNKIFALILRYGLGIAAGSANKRLPAFAFSSPDDVRIGLLTGLFNGDGFVIRGENHVSMGYASVSKDLISDMGYLLSTFGIFSRKRKASMKSNPLANHEFIGKVCISSQFMEKLASLIELKPGHRKRLAGIAKRKGVKIEFLGDFALDGPADVQTFEAEEQFVYDLEVESKSHTFVAGDGILVSNCFFFCKKGDPIYEPSLGQLREMFHTLRAQKPIACNAVQLTGGEPLMRDDIVKVIELAKEEGFDHIQLNTNGVRLSQDPELAEKIAALGSHVLYMSFDGVTPQTNPKNYYEAPKALENCRNAGIGVVLVPTVINGFNDHEVGDILRFGFGNIDAVRGINYQPVSFVGQMPDALRRKQRITIPGVIHRIEEQTGGAVTADDFYPVPVAKQVSDFIDIMRGRRVYRLSEHFACGMATYIFRDGDRMVPLPQFFDVSGFFEYLEKTGQELTGKSFMALRKPLVYSKLLRGIGRFVDEKKKPAGLKFVRSLSSAFTGSDYRGLGVMHHDSLFVGMMHFQDPYNWDIDRIHKCGIHYAVPDGRLIPFCTFNVIPGLYRDSIQAKFATRPKEWEKATGKKLEEDKYVRKLTEEQKAAADAFYAKFRGKPRRFADDEWGQEPTAPTRRRLRPPPAAAAGAKPITKDMLIAELVSAYPQALPILLEAGIHCAGCGMAAMETLGQGLKAHGKSDAEVVEIIARMRNATAK